MSDEKDNSQRHSGIRDDGSLQAQGGEQLLRQLAENIRGVFWIHDLDSGRFVYVSGAYETIFGRSCQDLYENPQEWIGAVHPDDHDRIKRSFKKEQRGICSEYEYQIVRPDGSIRWIYDRGFQITNESGRVSRLAGIAEDITDRKRAEEAIQKSEANYRTIFNAANEAIFVHDTGNGRILSANDMACEMFGYTQEEFQELTVENISINVSPYTQQKAIGWIKKAAREGPQLFEWICKDKHGKTFWVDVNLKLAVIEGTNRMLAIVRNINERKDAEARQQLANKILDRLNQKSQRSELARDVLALIKEAMGFTAVAIRLREGDDFPYFQVDGFSDELVKSENYLCARDECGKLIRDSKGQPVLECMCGKVIIGNMDSALPFFTEGGSFWTSSTTELLKQTSLKEQFCAMRSYCNQAGFESVALVPLRFGDEVVGLLQLNDQRPGRFTPEIILFLEGIGASIGIALERIAAQEEVRNLAKFPSENPNPVLRISKDGILLYANAASQSLLDEWDCRTGQTVPENWREKAQDVLDDDTETDFSLEHRGRTISFTVAPLAEAGYANFYGRDITERRQAELALKENEKRLRTVFEQAGDAMFLITFDEGRFVDVNQRACDALGYTRKELLSLSVPDIAPAYPKEKFAKFVRTLEKGKPVMFEAVHRRKDGTTYSVEIRTGLIDVQGRNHLLSMVRDISDRKAAREEIENLARFPSENPSPVLRVAENGALLYANDASGLLLDEWDCRVGQIIPSNWSKIVSEVYSSGTSRRIESEHSGRVFAFMVVPVLEAHYVNLYGRDITERKKAQEILRISEERFRRAILESPFPIMIHADDGEVFQISKVWTELTGYTPEEIPTLSAWIERAYGERKDIVKSRIDKIFDSDTRVEEGEYVITSKDGKSLTWDFSSAPLGKLPDARRLVISMAIDITERKQAEQQLENLAKFPSESPYPILRIAEDGEILYSNSAGSEILREWSCGLGEHAPEHWQQYISRVLKNDISNEIEFACSDKIFSLIIAPVVDAGYANVYGIDITERKHAEEELRKYRLHLEELVKDRTMELTAANEQLLQKNKQRRRLEKQILEISEREQRRIGQELHDSIGQQFTGIAFMTKVLEQRLASKLPEEAASAAKIAKLVNQATEQARSLAKGLHPIDLEAGSLMSALEDLANGTQNLFGIRCTFKCDKSIETGNTTMAVNLYRIVQEAINNAIKHGNARNININLSFDGNKSVLTIENDGSVFPDTIIDSKGMGLQIMSHRAELIDGLLKVRKGAKGGAVVTCTFPTTNK